MKQLLTIFCVALFALAMSGCTEETHTPKPSVKASQPTAQPTAQPAAMPEAAPGKTGTVTETMDAAGYTYIQVDTGAEQFWAAAPQFDVKVGDEVVVPEGMPMENHHSKTLDRTFELVFFVPAVLVGGEQTASMPASMPAGHPPIAGATTEAVATDIDLSGISKAEDGQTIAEIFARKDELAGKPVKVRGKIVKFNPEIMGKNWLHIQDGTGEAGSNDLTVTTNTMADVGDTVSISGTLVTDKDFGFGYQYKLIIEDAAVTVE